MDLQLVKNEPALILHEGKRRILVVADLHIGFERTLFRQEQYSVNVTDRIIQHFEDLVAESKPNEIIILGDLKHTIKEFTRQEFHKIAQLLHRLQEIASVTIIRGNHDADLELVVPDETKIAPSSGLRLSFRTQQVFLLHGHAHPSPDFLSCESLLMGHIHPTFAISSLKERILTHRVWVRTKWNPTITDAVQTWFRREKIQLTETSVQRLLEMKILIIPAFLNLLRGHILNRPRTEDWLSTPIFQHLAQNEAELIMLDHTVLGRLEELHPDKKNR